MSQLLPSNLHDRLCMIMHRFSKFVSSSTLSSEFAVLRLSTLRARQVVLSRRVDFAGLSVRILVYHCTKHCQLGWVGHDLWRHPSDLV